MTSCIFDKGGMMKKILLVVLIVGSNGLLFCSKEIVNNQLRPEEKIFINHLDNPMAVFFIDKNDRKFNFTFSFGCQVIFPPMPGISLNIP